jgi:succinoglycan biosynthesis transport protein ExoP
MALWAALMPLPTGFPGKADLRMSFRQFFNILWVRRGVIIFTTLACLLGALVAIRILPPRYEATTRVVLDIVKPDPVTGEAISSAWARAYVKTQIELITDYRVAGKVVDSLGWTSSPIWAARYAARSKDDHSDFRRWLAETVIAGTDAKTVDASNILEIKYSSSSADAARKTVNAIRQAYFDQTLAFKREGAARNAEWFHQQAEKLRDQLAEAEKKKADFEKSNGIILQDDNVDTEMSRLKAISASAPAAAAAVAPAATGTSPLAVQLSQLDAQIANAQQTLGPSHPDLLNMQRQRATLAASVAREAAAARSAGGGVVSGPSVESMMNAQTRKVLEQRGKVYEAQRLATDVAVLRDQFNKTLTRASELDRESQSTETGLTLLGDAVAPDDPAFPKKGLIFGAALGVGIALGVLISLVMEMVYRRVRCTEDLGLIGLPVLGVMSIDRREQGKRGIMYWLGFDELFKRKSRTTTS